MLNASSAIPNLEHFPLQTLRQHPTLKRSRSTGYRYLTKKRCFGGALHVLSPTGSHSATTKSPWRINCRAHALVCTSAYVAVLTQRLQEKSVKLSRARISLRSSSQHPRKPWDGNWEVCCLWPAQLCIDVFAREAQTAFSTGGYFCDAPKCRRDPTRIQR